jgi:hypothetical protein
MKILTTVTLSLALFFVSYFLLTYLDIQFGNFSKVVGTLAISILLLLRIRREKLIRQRVD